MNYKTINNKGQAKIFKSPFLERLTKTKPFVIYTMYIPLVTFLVFYGYFEWHYPPEIILILMLTAMVFWTLVEYLTHRFLFHFEAKTEIGKRLVYIFHENHHEYPRDKSRLFMPPIPSILIAILYLSFFALISVVLTGEPGYGVIFFSGFILGYLIYVSMHFAIHAYAPPKYLKALWRHHHLHHYKYPDKAFGVSSAFWDVLFRTSPSKEQFNNENPKKEEKI